ncbi:MAG: hypothetical protein EU548_06820 [Promethearchaeota archaeon]|nr:MAG: hypothetical protein EU548_06820 [Candidatus Lokiarchaeota archaeon]
MESNEEDIEYKLLEIQAFLSIPDEKFKLKQLLQTYYPSPQVQSIILSRILSFLYKFQLFKEVEPFMMAVYSNIYKTLEVEIKNLEEFEFILVKISLTGFIQDYVNFMKIHDKEKVFEFLTQSFGKLGLEPLIINLGLLLKPLYQEQVKLEPLEALDIEKEEPQLAELTEIAEEIEEVQILVDTAPKLIKEGVNDWFEAQVLDLDSQDLLREKLKIFYDDMAEIYDIKQNSELYNQLLVEVNEMLSLKLTVLSLMESVSDTSFNPLPIK